jgi:hypothetical protein
MGSSNGERRILNYTWAYIKHFIHELINVRMNEKGTEFESLKLVQKHSRKYDLSLMPFVQGLCRVSRK